MAEVELVTNGRENIDASCFRLRQPTGDEGLPWLKRGSLAVRKGPPVILEIRSDLPLVDPIMQVGLVVGCGHEVGRDYTLFLSPQRDVAEVRRPPVQTPVAEVPEEPRRRIAQRPVRADSEAAASQLRPLREKRPPPVRRDRLLLSAGGEEGEAMLRLDGELASWKAVENAALLARRDLLRLEFRMLQALNEQAYSQLDASEKLRNMEAMLTELQLRAGDFAQRMEGQREEAAPVPPAPVPAPMTQAPSQAVVPAQPVVKPSPPSPEASLLSEWSFYGLLLGGVLGLAGWLGWRQYQQRRESVGEPLVISPEPIPDPRRDTEFDEPGGVDLPVEPAAMGMPMQVDLHLDDTVVTPPPAPALAPAPLSPARHDSQFSVSAATVDEHFEANPVMELAEIMLSFGRVKGAAQALQEFIDNSPEEALQPWIRLLDVYRMAGMREEFDRVAHNLNQHFNVEILRWDADEPVVPPSATLEKLDFELVPRDEDLPAGSSLPKAMTLEDMPHIRQTLIDDWSSPNITDYLHRLLRDNRGGKRIGFTLEVVQEILFLIELQETLALIEREKNEQGDKK